MDNNQQHQQNTPITADQVKYLFNTTCICKYNKFVPYWSWYNICIFLFLVKYHVNQSIFDHWDHDTEISWAKSFTTFVTTFVTSNHHLPKREICDILRICWSSTANRKQWMMKILSLFDLTFYVWRLTHVGVSEKALNW